MSQILLIEDDKIIYEYSSSIIPVPTDIIGISKDDMFVVEKRMLSVKKEDRVLLFGNLNK